MFDLFSIGDQVAIINSSIIQNKKVGVVDQILDNAIVVKISGNRYAFEPKDLKFLDPKLQEQFEAELTLKEANERLDAENTLKVEEPEIKEPNFLNF